MAAGARADDGSAAGAASATDPADYGYQVAENLTGTTSLAQLDALQASQQAALTSAEAAVGQNESVTSFAHLVATAASLASTNAAVDTGLASAISEFNPAGYTADSNDIQVIGTQVTIENDFASFFSGFAQLAQNYPSQEANGFMIPELEDIMKYQDAASANIINLGTPEVFGIGETAEITQDNVNLYIADADMYNDTSWLTDLAYLAGY